MRIGMMRIGMMRIGMMTNVRRDEP
jgi:hypothetical protein